MKPVVDLADHIHVEAYEAPDRLKDQNALVDIHCVFPHCTKPAPGATPTTSIAYADGGPTCSDNTAPLCRRHHRAKTHSTWDYSVLDRGTYLWTTPNGLKLIRDHRGTARTLTTPPHTPASNRWPGLKAWPVCGIRVSVRVIFGRSPDVGDPACVNSSHDRTRVAGLGRSRLCCSGADRLVLC